MDDDAKLAAQLQAEEDARAAGNRDRGENSGYYNNASSNNLSSAPIAPQPTPGGYDQQQSSGNRGFLGRLLGKSPNKQYNAVPPPQGQYPPQHGGYGGYGSPPPPPPQGYGGYPPQGGYYPPQQGYYPPQQGYYPQQGYAQPPPKKSGGGLGTAGAAALGIGGGLLAGALITDAIQDHDQAEYQQGYDQGYDNGYDNGGGDDFGGGDF